MKVTFLGGFAAGCLAIASILEAKKGMKGMVKKGKKALKRKIIDAL